LNANKEFVISPDVKIHEFLITDVRVVTSDFTASYLARYSDVPAFHKASLLIDVDRAPEYYLSRIMSVILFVLSMAGGVFFLGPDDLANRFNLTLTLFLTAVAFHFVVSAELPKIAYATRLDKFIAFMYFLLFATAVENIIANRLTRKYDIATIENTLDLAAIIAFYVILFLGTLWFVWPYLIRRICGKPAVVRQVAQHN